MSSRNYLSYSRFHCNETRVNFINYCYVAAFTYSNYLSYSRFHCTETRVIFINCYVAESAGRTVRGTNSPRDRQTEGRIVRTNSPGTNRPGTKSPHTDSNDAKPDTQDV